MLFLQDKLDVPMFFGFVGLFTFVSLWPLFLILHYTEYEVSNDLN